MVMCEKNQRSVAVCFMAWFESMMYDGSGFVPYIPCNKESAICREKKKHDLQSYGVLVLLCEYLQKILV